MNLKTGYQLAGGRYRVERVLGQGGFGITYEARDTRFKSRVKSVAIKEFFVKDFCNREQETNRIIVATQSKVELVEKLRNKFIDEANALFELEHPGIVRVTDTFEENGTAYYVMEYINGSSLSTIIETEGPLNENKALGYVRQAASALEYLHGQNRLHLDIKPQNIMVDNDGRVVLIDFGVSKQYDEVNGENTSTLLGSTPGYAPIEQSGSGIAEFYPSTDIYSLGATLYKLLTGNTPLPAHQLASGDMLPPLPHSVSVKTRKAVESAMSLNRNKRPQSIGEFLSLLECHSEQSEESQSGDDDGATVVAITSTPGEGASGGCVISSESEKSPENGRKEILRSAQNDKERVEEDDSNRALVISTERSDGGETVVDRHFSVHSEKSSSNDCEEIKELNIVGKMELRYNKKYVYAVSASSILFFLSLFMPIYDDCSVYFSGWFHNDDIQYGVDLCFLYSISFKVYMFIVAMNPILQILKGDNKYYRVLTTLIGCAGLVYVVPFLDDVLYGDIWYGLYVMCVSILGMIFVPCFYRDSGTSEKTKIMHSKKYVLALCSCFALFVLSFFMPFIGIGEGDNAISGYTHLASSNNFYYGYKRDFLDKIPGVLSCLFFFWILVNPVLQLVKDNSRYGRLMNVSNIVIICTGVLVSLKYIEGWQNPRYGVYVMMCSLLGMGILSFCFSNQFKKRNRAY
jgi:serine/threonine protein kinase